MTPLELPDALTRGSVEIYPPEGAGTVSAGAPRPLAVTILGWAFAGLSAFAVVSSGFVLAFLYLMTRFAPADAFPPQAKDFPPGWGGLEWMFRHFDLLAATQAAVALFSVFAAVRFLRLRSWARIWFEALCWLALLWTVGFGVLFGYAWSGTAAALPVPAAGQPVPPPAFFRAFGFFVATAVSLFNAVFPAAFLWLLRSRHVRPAFRRGE